MLIVMNDKAIKSERISAITFNKDQNILTFICDGLCGGFELNDNLSAYFESQLLTPVELDRNCRMLVSTLINYIGDDTRRVCDLHNIADQILPPVELDRNCGRKKKGQFKE